MALAAAEHVRTSVDRAVAERGVAHVALTGGSTPEAVYRHLVASPPGLLIRWERVHLWWGDDRFVPRADPLSNVAIADRALFRGPDGGPGIPVGDAQVHPFPCDEALAQGRDPAWCAGRYATEVRRLVPAGPSGWPSFDLVMLGIGPDGHILSVFPGSPALDSPELALGIPAPSHVEPHVPRVTLNPAIVGSARDVLVVVESARKASILATIMGPERDPHRWPAQLALTPMATWLVDVAAASELPHDPAP